jgi:hypothetical protein
MNEYDYLLSLEDTEIDLMRARVIARPPERVGCAFGSVVEIPEPPPIDDAVAVATCKRIAEELQTALEKTTG